MIKAFVFLFLTTPITLQAQVKGDNLIKVHGVGFIQACNALLDAGYVIEKKDNDLQTAKTEVKDYDKYWNASFFVSLRVKDSIAHITVYFTAPGRDGGLFKDEKASFIVTKKGQQKKALASYPLWRINDLVLSFRKPVTYSKE